MFKFKKSLGNINRSSNNEDRSKYKFRLDRNEKIFPFKDQDKNKFNKYLNSIDLNLYPNLEKSYKKLSKLLRIDRKNILITEGVSGAIKNILDSTEINRNTEIVVPNPSFALYKIYSKIYDLKLKTYNYDNKFNSGASNFITDDLHPFVMKPAAPQLHMQKLHMQTSMEKLDLEPAMETVSDDVHVQAVQPMKCGKAMKVEPVACAKHETEHAHGDMKCKHEDAGAKTGNKKKKKKKKSEESTLGQIGKAIFGQHCDSCGELHDGDHDCEVEAFQAMLDGYDSEGQALEKPRCASVGLANRKLNELH